MPPNVIEALLKSNKEAVVKLSPELAKAMEINEIDVDENNFRKLLNEKEIENEKLSEGIKLFIQGIYNFFY